MKSSTFYETASRKNQSVFPNSTNPWQWSPSSKKQVQQGRSPERTAGRGDQRAQSCGPFACEGKLHFWCLCATSARCERGCPAASPLTRAQLEGSWRHHCQELCTPGCGRGKISAVDGPRHFWNPSPYLGGVAVLKAVPWAQSKCENGKRALCCIVTQRHLYCFVTLGEYPFPFSFFSLKQTETKPETPLTSVVYKFALFFFYFCFLWELLTKYIPCKTPHIQ